MPSTGKRNTLIGRTVMGKPIFATINTNGILLYLDANNNRSYNGSGSTWFDLASPSHDVTLVGSPSFNSTAPEFFSFNGSTQYGTSAGVTVPQAAYTKCVWFRLNSYASNNNLVSSQAGGHFMFLATTNKLYCGHADWNTLYGLGYNAYPSTASFDLNKWYFAQLTFDTTNGMRLYINGVLDSTFTSGGTWNKNAHGGDGSTEIASFGAGNLLNGDISIVLTYGRAITDTEALINYQATKSIFGY